MPERTARRVQPGRQCHGQDRTEHRQHTKELGVDDAAGDEAGKLNDPDLTGEGAQDRVERQEVPFRNDVCRCDQRVGLNIVVRVAQIVRHEADNGPEHDQDHGQREQVLDHEIRPERQRVFLRLVLGTTTHFNTCRVVVASGVEGPDMHDNQCRDDERQQVMQREEAVQRGVVHSGPAQQPGLQRVTNKRDRTEQGR